jgi:hypothetical protein
VLARPAAERQREQKPEILDGNDFRSQLRSRGYTGRLRREDSQLTSPPTLQPCGFAAIELLAAFMPHTLVEVPAIVAVEPLNFRYHPPR